MTIELPIVTSTKSNITSRPLKGEKAAVAKTGINGKTVKNDRGVTIVLPDVLKSDMTEKTGGVDWGSIIKKSKERDKEMSEQYDRVRKSLKESLDSTRSTLDKINTTKLVVKDSMDHAKALDKRWEKFQSDFDEAMSKMVDRIGRAMKRGGGLGLGSPTMLKPINEGEEGPSDIQKRLVLGMDLTLNAITRKLRAKSYSKVVVLMGAGCSTSAGIPDFRTPGTGLYSNMSRYNLPYPEAAFELDYFNNIDPKPFAELSKGIYPGRYSPTLAHRFVKKLQDEGILHRCYTQNIDGLERLAGVDEERLIEAHGSFRGEGFCGLCKAKVEEGVMKDGMLNGRCVPCPRGSNECKGNCKPPIVFFGEDLPLKFKSNYMSDLRTCDLLIVMGTSLSVAPFCSLPLLAGDTVPRLLINSHKVGIFKGDGEDGVGGGSSGGGDYNYRDVVYEGLVDDGVEEFGRLMGWEGWGGREKVGEKGKDDVGVRDKEKAEVTVKGRGNSHRVLMVNKGGKYGHTKGVVKRVGRVGKGKGTRE